MSSVVASESAYGYAAAPANSSVQQGDRGRRVDRASPRHGSADIYGMAHGERGTGMEILSCYRDRPNKRRRGREPAIARFSTPPTRKAATRRAGIVTWRPSRTERTRDAWRSLV